MVIDICPIHNEKKITLAEHLSSMSGISPELYVKQANNLINTEFYKNIQTLEAPTLPQKIIDAQKYCRTCEDEAEYEEEL